MLNPGIVLGSAVLAAAGVYALAVVLFRMEPWRPRLSGWRWLLALAVAANWLYLLTVSRP
jgi:formate hydrogenlyase subunit 3/multisubunit Na+/H+ antiporter MnhD subunit